MRQRDMTEAPVPPPNKQRGPTMGEYFETKNSRKYVTRNEMSQVVTHMINNARKAHSPWWRFKAWCAAQWARTKSEATEISTLGQADDGGE